LHENILVTHLYTKEFIKKAHTLTLALSPQGRGVLRLAPPLRGGDKGEGV